MSVARATPYFSLTLDKISSPFSSPGPLKDEIEERFALSNEALKIYWIPSLSVISFIFPATSITKSSDSITQGPAIKKILSLPIVILSVIFTFFTLFISIILILSKYFSYVLFYHNITFFANFFLKKLKYSF